MINIILFGQMGSGKDTVAEILEDKLGLEIIKLGSILKEEADIYAAMTGVEKNKRQLYQEYGQGMRAIFGPDFWNINLFESIQYDFALGSKFIIADGRQESEYAYWTSLGFIPIAVTADEDVRLERIKGRDGFDQSIGVSHETELSAEKIIAHIKTLEPTRQAFTIVNNDTIENLHEQIDHVIDNIIIMHTMADSV